MSEARPVSLFSRASKPGRLLQPGSNRQIGSGLFYFCSTMLPEGVGSELPAHPIYARAVGRHVHGVLQRPLPCRRLSISTRLAYSWGGHMLDCYEIASNSADRKLGTWSLQIPSTTSASIGNRFARAVGRLLEVF